MQLEEFFDYKNRLMEDLLTNEKIVRMLSDDETLIDNPAQLVYTQIHPYEFIPDTVTHGQTFICCDVDISKSMNKTYLNPDLFIWVFTHKSRLRLKEGGVRVDMLCSEIAKTINGSRCYGLGELDLYSVKRFAPINEYQGKVMYFQASEYNRLSNPNKFIPSNRKQI